MKKHTYFATFISGLHEPIKSLLKNNIRDCNIILLLDGVVVFETSLSYDRLGMHCFNNIFAVINIQKVSTSKSNLEKYIKKIIDNKLIIDKDILINNNKKIKTFRVVISEENKLISINQSIKSRFEKLIERESKLLLNRSKSDTEFWAIYRSEGYCFFLKRLSKHIAYEKLLNRGELHPELAFLLNYISEPQKTDVCLDPFCGYGSIPLQRLKHFPTEKFYAFDISERALNISKKKLKKHINHKCIIRNVDINSIEHIVNFESIDKIITDPPWGLYEKIENIEEFYKMVLSKCINILKPDGKIVILTAKKGELLNAVNVTMNCFLIKVYNILVSGKKAGIFLITKSK